MESHRAMKIGPLAVISLMISVLPCEAGFLGRSVAGVRLPAPSALMQETRAQATPLGYLGFCSTYSSQCASSGTNERITLTSDVWRTIRQVNAEVNARIRPDAGKGAYGWSLEATSGNCNDYAVQKRKALIDRGLPASALSLSVVLTRRGVGHLVLTVRTDRGDYVMDNLRQSVLAWDRTGYRFNRVQSLGNSEAWVLPEAGASGERSL
jgi:predicted transglutaminase-like cysteine proteinase